MATRAVGRTSFRGASGYSLIEVAVALGVLAVAMAGLAPFFIQVAQTTGLAARQTSAHVLAVSKAHELRALWAASEVVPAASPPATLDADVPGWAEWLDQEGRVFAGPTPDAHFVRRWAARPVGPGADAYVLVVLVKPVQAAGRRTNQPRQPGDGWAFSATRRSP